VTNARRAYERRRFRREWIGSKELFREPAWDMMIYLYIAHGEGRAVPVNELCRESYIPQPSALREVNKLCAAGLARRIPDPNDGRRSFVELTSSSRLRLDVYFGAEEEDGERGENGEALRMPGEVRHSEE